MLALSRLPHETIVIKQDGIPDIVIVYTGRYGDQIRLAIDAPMSATILRGELLERGCNGRQKRDE